MKYVLALCAAAGCASFITPGARASIVLTGAADGPALYTRHAGIPPALMGTGIAYDAPYSAGVRVALGDLTGDGIPDVVSGTGLGAAHVKVFDGQSGQLARSFLPYGGFTGGVYVGAGDIDDDGYADIITGAGPGAGPHVKVFSGQSGAETSSFFAYPNTFQGGVRVATGDVNGDGVRDIVTGAGAGGGGHVKVFDGQSGTEIRSFFAFDGSFTGGVNVAAGDLDGDGRADLIVGADSAASHVKVFSGATGALLQSFFAFAGFQGGVSVAAGDINGDGRADLIAGMGEGGSLVRIISGLDGTDLATFAPMPSLPPVGVFVAGDGGPIPAPGAGLVLGAGALLIARRRR